MAGMINQLIEVMNEQAERHSELLGLSVEEKDAIIQNDVDTLQKLVNLKNIVISQNNRLEKKRITLVNDIAEVLGHGKKDIDLSELIELLDGQAEQAELREVGARLRQIVTELKEANDLNKELLESALEFVDYSLNALRSTIAPEPPAYPTNIRGKGGEEIAGTFDTKQ